MIRCLSPVLVALVLAVQPASSQTLLTAASNVRLRAAPGTSTTVVAMLPLGTELEIADSVRSGTWIHVRVPSGARQQGWIDESLTLTISDSTYPDIVSDLISSRLDRQGDGFVSRTELLAFIEAALRWDDHVASWLDERAAEVGYNEPGGHWIIHRNVILDHHAEYRATEVADEIAWFAVLNGLPGECEGALLCYLEWSDRLEGEYLRREPAGRHVAEAAARLSWVIEYYTTSFKPNDFDPQRECDALDTAIASLDAAVRGSSAPDRDVIAAQLRDMRELCS